MSSPWPSPTSTSSQRYHDTESTPPLLWSLPPSAQSNQVFPASVYAASPLINHQNALFTAPTMWTFQNINRPTPNILSTPITTTPTKPPVKTPHRRSQAGKPRKQLTCFLCPRAEPTICHSVMDLERHLKSVHKHYQIGSKYWVCTVPGCIRATKKWPRLDNFNAHVNRMHPEQNRQFIIHTARRVVTESEVNQNNYEYSPSSETLSVGGYEHYEAQPEIEYALPEGDQGTELLYTKFSTEWERFVSASAGV